LNWQLLARANTHPLRISILEVLVLDGGRTLSPKDLSVELQAPLSTVNYHVTELAKAGLIEIVSERQVRGAVEHFYRALDAEERSLLARQYDHDEEGDHDLADDPRVLTHPVANGR
jgi:DNA-binding transcriptional ArsR family regulator